MVLNNWLNPTAYTFDVDVSYSKLIIIIMYFIIH